MFANTLQMINNSIVDIKSGQDTALPVVFNGLPDDEDLLTGLCHEKEGLGKLQFNFIQNDVKLLSWWKDLTLYRY